MPFAGYKNFAACVAANSSKKDPKAYCATIMRATEADFSDKPGGSGDSSTKKEGEVGKIERRISDLFDINEAEFSVEEGTGRMIATVTILKAGRSKNPRNYTEGALSRAAEKGVFNGLRMFVNHSDKPPTKRSLTEMVSAVESTSWNPEKKTLDGTVEFFNKDFYEFAKRAKNYMGDSINALARGDRVRQPNGEIIENVTDIVKGHSVDWVVYPAAGGEIQQFMESEGDAEVEWTEITLDNLITNGPPALWDAIRQHVKEAEEAGKGDPKEDPKPELTKDEIATLVAQAIKEHDDSKAKEEAAKAEAKTKIEEMVLKAGLPSKTQKRIMLSFQNAQSFKESEVTEAIQEAQEELKAAGAGPRITGMGPSGGGEAVSSHPTGILVSESVEAHFGISKDLKKDPKDDKKE